jgi:hypothetical protein
LGEPRYDLEATVERRLQAGVGPDAPALGAEARELRRIGETGPRGRA